MRCGKPVQAEEFSFAVVARMVRHGQFDSHKLVMQRKQRMPSDLRQKTRACFRSNDCTDGSCNIEAYSRSQQVANVYRLYNLNSEDTFGLDNLMASLQLDDGNSNYQVWASSSPQGFDSVTGYSTRADVMKTIVANYRTNDSAIQETAKAQLLALRQKHVYGLIAQTADQNFAKDWNFYIARTASACDRLSVLGLQDKYDGGKQGTKMDMTCVACNADLLNWQRVGSITMMFVGVSMIITSPKVQAVSKAAISVGSALILAGFIWLNAMDVIDVTFNEKARYWTLVTAGSLATAIMFRRFPKLSISSTLLVIFAVFADQARRGNMGADVTSEVRFFVFAIVGLSVLYGLYKAGPRMRGLLILFVMLGFFVFCVWASIEITDDGNYWTPEAKQYTLTTTVTIALSALALQMDVEHMGVHTLVKIFVVVCGAIAFYAYPQVSEKDKQEQVWALKTAFAGYALAPAYAALVSVRNNQHMRRLLLILLDHRTMTFLGLLMASLGAWENDVRLTSAVVNTGSAEQDMQKEKDKQMAFSLVSELSMRQLGLIIASMACQIIGLLMLSPIRKFGKMRRLAIGLPILAVVLGISAVALDTEGRKPGLERMLSIYLTANVVLLIFHGLAAARHRSSDVGAGAINLIDYDLREYLERKQLGSKKDLRAMNAVLNKILVGAKVFKIASSRGLVDVNLKKAMTATDASTAEIAFEQAFEKLNFEKALEATGRAKSKLRRATSDIQTHLKYNPPRLILDALRRQKNHTNSNHFKLKILNLRKHQIILKDIKKMRAVWQQ